ncbi:ATP-binding protein, partial [Candidatus Gracilibacteria bacterium]|nr:ATP-binding protein [Candidatus Gracilibacteria bacterium]
MQNYIIIFFLSAIFLTFIFFIFRSFLAKKYHKNNLTKYKTLKIWIDKTNETGPIAMENIFATIYSSKKELGFSDWFYKKELNRISFEFCNIGAKTGLYIFCEEKDAEMIKSQLYSAYPDIEIEEIEDYAKKGIYKKSLKKNHKGFEDLMDLSTAKTAELGLLTNFIFPIKRYSQFEDKTGSIDPISGILGALGNLNSTCEQAWIQIVLRPASSEWILKGKNLIKKHGFFIKLEGENEVETEGKVNKSDETPSIASNSKMARLLFETNIRIVYIPKKENEKSAGNKLKEITSSFFQFNQSHLNSFKIRQFSKNNKNILKRFQNRTIIKPFILNNEELATLWHLPLESVKLPNLDFVSSKKLEAPLNLPGPENTDPEDFTMMGKTNFRGQSKYFGMKNVDRRRHVYVIGKTGMGKSTILENMLFSDIQAGKGVTVIDPHGDLAEAVISFVPSNRVNDVVIFDPSDTAFPVSFNMLECKNPEQFDTVADGLLGVFKKMFADSWGPRLEHFLRNAILALVEIEGTTMLSILRIFNDSKYRDWIVKQIKNPTVISFWKDEFGKMQDRQRQEALGPIQNKVGQFLSSATIRNIFGQRKSSIDLRFAMDKKKIIIINLSKGKIGEVNSSLLGSMLVTKFQIDAMSRANIPERDRVDHYLYVDEFQNFATDSFGTILSEARKYKLCLN